MTNLPHVNYFTDYKPRKVQDNALELDSCNVIDLASRRKAGVSHASQRTPVLAEAARQIALGRFVFVAPRGGTKSGSFKGKHKKDGERGRWDQTHDLKRFEGQLKSKPDANLGLPMGFTNGLICVEADTLDAHGVNGLAGIAKLEAEHGVLPATWMQRSPSGSIHRIYLHPGCGADGKPIKVTNSASDLAPGVDIRGDAGMILLAPSKRKGVAYERLNELPPAKAPPWLVERLTHEKAKTSTSSKPFLQHGKDNERTTYAKDLKNLISAGFRDQELSVTQKMANDHVPLDKMMKLFLAATAALIKREKLPWKINTKAHIEKLRVLCQSAIDKVANEEEEADKRSSPAGVREDIEHHKRPTIRVVAGGLSEAADLGAEALIGADVQIYHRGDDLVRPVVEETQATHDRKTMVARFVVVSPAQMRDQLDLVAHWQKYSATAGGFVPANVPEEVATRIMSRIGTWPFPKVAGIISTPTMRHDGTILSAEGFDDATKLLLLTPPPMPAIPESPTRSDALAALATLEELLVEFPFVGDVDRAVALSALITPIVRAAFLVAPMHAVDAPVAGSGKSFLIDCSSAIATGQRMPVISKGASEEELEKRLGAELMSGQSLICIDNVNGELKGDALCQIVERPMVHVRILGKSEKVIIESRSTTVFANGNNITIVGDLCRRVIKSMLDPHLERPELREFKGDPIAQILDNRGKYIAACLTICRAYIVAGRPNKAKRLASYEDWSDTVRSSLMWLGRADSVASMDDMRADDPELSELGSVLTAWAEAFGSGWKHRITLDHVVEKVKSGESKWANISAALEGAARVGKEPISTKCLATWLRSKKGRIVGGEHFTNKTNNKHAAEWWVDAG